MWSGLQTSLLAMIPRCLQLKMPAQVIRFAWVPRASHSHTLDRPISPSLSGNFEKEQSGTYFGKTATFLPSGVPCDGQLSRPSFLIGKASSFRRTVRNRAMMIEPCACRPEL